MSNPQRCRCPDCGGRAKLIETRPMKETGGRRRRYSCLEAGCGVRWSEWIGERSRESLRQAPRAGGTVAGAPVRYCYGCGHWLTRCGLEIPEAASDPTFAGLCSAWLEISPAKVAAVTRKQP